MKNLKTDGTKPYDRCLRCEFLGNGCDGPRTSSMSLERLCEWLRAVKKIRGLTNAQIAEDSDLSVTTVERFMSGNFEKDIRRATSTALENAVIGSTGEYPCYMAFMDSVPDKTRELLDTMKELERLQATYDKMIEAHKEELKQVREEAQKKIDFLVKENEKKDRLIQKLIDR